MALHITFYESSKFDVIVLREIFNEIGACPVCVRWHKSIHENALKYNLRSHLVTVKQWLLFSTRDDFQFVLFRFDSIRFGQDIDFWVAIAQRKIDPHFCCV